MKQKATKLYQLNPIIEDRIIQSYNSSLTDFYGLVTARDIQFVAYLQPVLLERHIPKATTNELLYPSINYFAVNFYSENKHWNRFRQNYVIRTEQLYQKAENMYRNLNKIYPSHFHSIINSYQEEENAAKVYKKDAIHYTQYGSEIIARKIIKDLINKSILTKSVK